METRSQYYNQPELWGGIECTINRVKDDFRDQLDYSGHYLRPDDIDRFAALGIRKLRYPILWERHQPVKGQKIDWSWATSQLELIRNHQIVPIAGLLHHGSGPAYTDLMDKKFPARLAKYAGAVAKQFPWIEYYTPVNEPLTTARFSGLYGFWYPHKRNPLAFARMLINQLKGVVLSMKEIRKINPAAKLVQTEDLAKTHSTPLLSYQAKHENERRWLTYDLLCGKLNRRHSFWNYFTALGIEEKELQFFLDEPCPPDILGFNYYVTSERYLDEKKEIYPSCTHGGNGKHAYADTEAVRAGKLEGMDVLLKEAWKRFRLPMAVTENHLSCSREEQLRWIKESWDTCKKLRSEGVDIRAMTSWSLLGAFDWNSLLSCHNNFYEPGVFDIRGKEPRPTALAKLLSSLTGQSKYDHPLLEQKGWWHRHHPQLMDKSALHKSPPLLIIGKNGTLGAAFSRTCEKRGIPYLSLSRQDVNILNAEEIRHVIELYKPWAIINAAGYVRVDDAETACNECFAVNATAPGLLADICKQYGIRFMTFSSDLVFDGNKNMPYHEADNVKPLNVYGNSKAEGEKLVMGCAPESLIIRTSAFFGPWDKYNFVYNVLESFKQNKTVELVKDVIVSPTYVPDLADTALDLFIDEEDGIWHLTNEGICSWAELGETVADMAGYKTLLVTHSPLDSMGWKAPRPKYSALASEKGIKMPALDNALVRYFEQRTV